MRVLPIIFLCSGFLLNHGSFAVEKTVEKSTQEYAKLLKACKMMGDTEEHCIEMIYQLQNCVYIRNFYSNVPEGLENNPQKRHHYAGERQYNPEEGYLFPQKRYYDAADPAHWHNLADPSEMNFYKRGQGRLKYPHGRYMKRSWWNGDAGDMYFLPKRYYMKLRKRGGMDIHRNRWFLNMIKIVKNNPFHHCY